MLTVDTCRWDSASEAVRLCDMPHRRLTRPKKVFEFFFDGAMKSSAQEGILKLEPVADGIMNAVCFWFDLHLDEEATITTAPEGVIGKGGVTLVLADASGEEAAPGASSPPHYWGQALQYLERSTQARRGLSPCRPRMGASHEARARGAGASRRQENDNLICC